MLRKDIQKLVKEEGLDAEYVFVSMYFHVDYDLIEKNLRPVIEKALQRCPGRVILVYGDLCLGMNDEMRKLAEEYGIAKVDALNCIDCQRGGKGKFLEADPHHDLMFLTPGMIDFFNHARSMMRKEGLDEPSAKQLFNGLRGIVLLDTLGTAEKLKVEAAKLETGIPILQTLQIGTENLRNVIKEAIERNKKEAGE